MTRPLHAALATATASTATTRHTAQLRAEQGQLRVDEKAGIIRGVCVMSIGPAKGHGFHVDRTTLEQTARCLASCPGGAKMRFDHPQPTAMNALGNATGRVVARLHNVRVDGNRVVGDVHLGSYAAATPGLGDIRAYLLGMAKDDPTAIGLSPVIGYDLETLNGVPVARVFDVPAVDFVDDPATNRRGLLSAKLEIHMDPKLLLALQALGLATDASEGDAQSFLDSLTPEQKKHLKALGFPVGDTAATAPTAPAGGDGTPAAMSANHAGGNFAALEAQRVSQIRQLGAMYYAPAQVINQAIVERRSPEQCMPLFLDALQAGNPDFGGVRPGSVHVGTDHATVGLKAAAVDALLARYGLRTELKGQARQLAGLDLAQLAAKMLQSTGYNTQAMKREDLIRALVAPQSVAGGRLAMLAAATGDYDSVLTSSVNAQLRQGYTEATLTWPMWARRETVKDFRTQERPILSELPTPGKVLPGQEYPNATPSDSKEEYTVSKYGQIVSFLWEALVNDQLGAFLRMAGLQGQAAARIEDDLVYAVLLANEDMSDGEPLFDSTAHGNVDAAGEPSVAKLASIRKLMAKQTGPQGAVLDLQPATLIVPVAYQTITEQLVASLVDPSKSNATTNPAFIRNMKVVSTARLDLGVTIKNADGSSTTHAGSATKWYAAAPSSQIDTVVVGFLDENPAPSVTEEEGFRVDKMNWKVRHVCGAKALDWRGVARNG